MSTNPASTPASSKLRATPLLKSKGFVPTTFGFVVRFRGNRMTSRALLENNIRAVNDIILANFGRTTIRTDDEVMRFVCDSYGTMTFGFNEGSLPPSIYELYNSTHAHASQILPGHRPIIQSWLGPALDIIYTSEVKTWEDLFDSLQEKKNEISKLFGFECNYIDWCVAERRRQAEEVERSLHATGSSTTPIPLPTFTDSYSGTSANTDNIRLDLLTPDDLQNIRDTLDSIPNDDDQPNTNTTT